MICSFSKRVVLAPFIQLICMTISSTSLTLLRMKSISCWIIACLAIRWRTGELVVLPVGPGRVGSTLVAHIFKDESPHEEWNLLVASIALCFTSD